MAFVVGNGETYKSEFTDAERKAALKASNRMGKCASWLKFRDFFEAKETHLVDARFCGRAALCEACARRRAFQVGQTYLPKFEGALDAKEGRILALLTLTIKSTDDLRSGLQLLKTALADSLAAARRYRNCPDRHPFTEFAKIAGGVSAVEVKRSKQKPGTLWHPHIHALVVLDDYLDQKKLSEEWKHRTGGSYVVDIRRIRADDIRDGIREALKYPVKFGDLSSVDCLRSYFAFRGIREGKAIRALSSFGCIRAVLPPLEEFDESKLKGPYWEWYAIWAGSETGYITREGGFIPGALAQAKRNAKAEGVWKEVHFIDGDSEDEDEGTGQEPTAAAEGSGGVGEAAAQGTGRRYWLAADD